MKFHQSTDVSIKVLNPLTIYFLTDSSTPEKYINKLRSLNKDRYIDRRIFTIGLEERDYFATIEKNHPGCNVLVRLFGGERRSSLYVADTIDVSSAKKDILPKLKDLIEKVYDLDIDLLEKQKKEYERADDRERQEAVTKILKAFRLTKPLSRSGIREIRPVQNCIGDSEEIYGRSLPGLDMFTDARLYRIKEVIQREKERLKVTGNYTNDDYDTIIDDFDTIIQLTDLIMDLKTKDSADSESKELSVKVLPYEGWKLPCRFLFNGGLEEVRMSSRLSVFIYVLALLIHKKGGVIDRYTLMWTIKEETIKKLGNEDIQQWFIDLYKALIHPVKTFPEWWEDITKDMTKFDRDLTLAVSNINASIRKAVGKKTSSLELKSRKFETKKGGDPRKVAFYYITLPKDKIYLDKKFERLLTAMPEFLVHTPGEVYIEE